MENKVAVITGGNAGIGFSVAERLLDEDHTIHVCLACRSKSRAENAILTLKNKYPSSTASFEQCDVSSLDSVYNAAVSIKSRFKHIDYLYLNAGIMPVSTVDWGNFWKGIFSSKCIHMFMTGDGLLKQVDSVTPDGLQQIFETNLFGHFVLIKELQDVLGGTQPSQIMWTSSSNAKKEAFSIDDIQHSKSKEYYEPYSSSKYASDMLSIAINHKFNKTGIYSHTTCPGLVMTGLTYAILPEFFWKLALPFMLLMRIVAPSMTLNTYNASEALVWLTHQKTESLDSGSKYYSRTSVTGSNYVETKQMNIDSQEAELLYKKLEELEAQIKKKS